MARILIVEDDKLLLKVYRNILTSPSQNHELLLAENGQDGFNYILEGGFDLILLDLKLPLKDGLQILTELKHSKPVKTNGPIIILSNVDDEKTIKKVMSLGAVGYITKDQINPIYLIKEVENYLRLKNTY